MGTFKTGNFVEWKTPSVYNHSAVLMAMASKGQGVSSAKK